MSKKDDQRQHARVLFAELALPAWKESGQDLRSGGQAGVIIVEKSQTGQRGVFRCLTQTTGNALDRFYRELRILTDPRFRHPNVVEILDHTKDEKQQWYISRLGGSFKGWWERFRRQHANDPSAVLKEAVQVVTQLAGGLASLHEERVVHRDIKPDNIVVEAAASPVQPILIDFGIAHVEDEERLTDPDAAVGNKRYSPDIMMNRMDQVPPWLDVFQLGQLLIWMTQVQSSTPHWDRPLDWRFVRYDSSLPDDLALAVRAVTAVCSEEQLSPPNSRALATLLRERFLMVESADPGAPEIDVTKVRQGNSRGKSVHAIALAEDARLIEASAAAVGAVYRPLRDGLEAITASLSRLGLSVRKSVDTDLGGFTSRLISRSEVSNESTLYQLDLGEPPEQQFHFRIQCVTFVPSLIRHMSGTRPPASSNPIFLYLQRYANLTRVAFPHHTKTLSVERDGALMLRDEQITVKERTDIVKVLTMIKGWLEDPVPWEMIQRDR